MENNLYQLILTSQSPRRKKLLSYLGIPFSVKPSNINEDIELNDPIELVRELARAKAYDVFQEGKANPFVIGSDTIVVIDGKILGKPKNREQAREFIHLLSGKVHQVYTAVCFKTSKNTEIFYDNTNVEFIDVSDKDIEVYLQFNEYQDKAGGYGIQGAANAFITKIEGSYSNVVGFPISMIIDKLREIFGINWRENFE